MAPFTKMLRIVATRPGPGTGDTYWQTEDGRWWEPYRDPCTATTATAATLGSVTNDGHMRLPPYPEGR